MRKSFASHTDTEEKTITFGPLSKHAWADTADTADGAAATRVTSDKLALEGKESSR